MGEVIYLPKRYVVNHDNNKNNAVPKLLFGVSGMLIIYGLYRLMRAFGGK